MVSAALSVVGICGGGRKQTVRVCVVSAERRQRSKLHLRQQPGDLTRPQGAFSPGSSVCCTRRSRGSATSAPHSGALLKRLGSAESSACKEIPSCWRDREEHNTEIEPCFAVDLLRNPPHKDVKHSRKGIRHRMSVLGVILTYAVSFWDTWEQFIRPIFNLL